MAVQKPYINCQLRRTLPKLSGNMMLDIIIGANRSENANCEAWVKQAHLRPISDRINYIPVVEERIMDRPHQLNIKRFYEKTKSNFYEQSIDPRLASDWPMVIPPAECPDLKYIKEFDDTYFAGCQRMHNKLYGCTHEVLIPVWLDQALGLRIGIEIASARTPSAKMIVELEISPLYFINHQDRLTQTSYKFHNDFLRYMLDYMDFTSISKGTNKVMSVDFKNNQTILRGLQVDTGNIQIRQNENIARNLIYRERPLLEANSLITNSFMDYKMIVSQLINFNICFDLKELISCCGSAAKDVLLKEQQYVISTYTCALRAMKDLKTNIYDDFDPRNPATYSWNDNPDVDGPDTASKLPLMDFYTNHHFIPKISINKNLDVVPTTYGDDQKNVLDYKKDYRCVDLMHKNKMTQSICHWCYADQPLGDNLFNLYDGFGAVDQDGNEYSHGQGTTFDINDDVYNEETDNTLWAGKPAIGTGATMANFLMTPQPHLESGYYKDASNFISGLKFNYDPTTINYPNTDHKKAPKALYIGTMTTPWNTHLGTTWSRQVTKIMSSQFIGILTDRALPNIKENTLPKSQNTEEFEQDFNYDFHYHSDIDNRWVISKTINNQDCRAWFDPTGQYLQKGTYVWLPASTKYTDRIEDKIQDIKTPGCPAEVYASMLVRIGGAVLDRDLSARDLDNTNALYVGFMRGYDHKKTEKEFAPDDPLYVIFYHGRSRVQNNSTDTIYRDLPPHGLTLGGVLSAIRDYWTKYKPISDQIDIILQNEPGVSVSGDLPDMDDFGLIVDLMTGLKAPEIIFFDNTVLRRQDITLSTRAQEHTYVKAGDANAYVWRYSGDIKPCMYEPKTIRLESDGNILKYKNWYGRNFLWIKKPYFAIGQTLPEGLARYINKNVPPLYPSLNYDSIQPLIVTGDDPYKIPYPISMGDLIYDEVPPIYLGRMDDGRNKWDLTLLDACPNPPRGVDSLSSVTPDMIINSKINLNDVLGQERTQSIAYWLYKSEYGTYEWPEYKWFNESKVVDIDSKINLGQISSPDNSKNILENLAINKLIDILQNQSGKRISIEYDHAFIRKTYDFDYNLIKAIPQTENNKIKTDPETGKVLYTYIYEIIAELK